MVQRNGQEMAVVCITLLSLPPQMGVTELKKKILQCS